MEELKHYGIPGMKWGKRKAKNTDQSSNKGSNKNNIKSNQTSKQWSTKKKLVVAGTVAVGTVLAAYGAKKIRDYVRNENEKIATKKALKAYTTGWENWQLMNKQKYNAIDNSFSSTAKKLTESERIDILKIMSDSRQRAANDSYREAYSKVKNVNFRQALKNVIEEKRKK